MVPKLWKKAAFTFAQRTGVFNILGSLGPAGQAREGFLYVLMYHRVDELDPERSRRPWLDPSLISASPAQLEQQFRLIASKYHPVSAGEVLAALDGNTLLPRGAVLVTVDDGYLDFGEVICPTARRYGIHPVLFVPTAFMGQGTFWWDKLYWAVFHGAQGRLSTPLGDYSLASHVERSQALSNLRYRLKRIPFQDAMQMVDELYSRFELAPVQAQRNTLNWEELRLLARDGATIAAHTHTHPLLSQIPFEQACAEIRTSQDLIRKEIGDALPIFAFPDGKPEFYTPELIVFLRSQGFKFAVTTNEGSARLTPDRSMRFPRLAARPSMNLASFQYRLTPVYNFGKG